MCDNCARLQRQVRELKEEIAEYERGGPPTDKSESSPYQIKYKMTPSEARTLTELIKSSPKPVSKDRLHFVVSGETEPQIVQVYVCRIRKKLPPATIITVSGAGYYIPTDKLEAVR